MSLTYEKHDDKRLLVKGDKDTFKLVMRDIGARRNNKLDGWLLAIENETKVQQIIDTCNEIETMTKNAKHIEPDTKYHRENSDWDHDVPEDVIEYYRKFSKPNDDSDYDEEPDDHDVPFPEPDEVIEKSEVIVNEH